MKKLLPKTATTESKLTSTTKSSSSSSSSSSSAAQTAAIIKNLLKSGNTSNTHQPLALTEQDDAARLDNLRRLFSKLQSTSELTLHGGSGGLKKSKSSSSTTKVQAKWNTWLKKQHATFLSQLNTTVQDGRKSSLRTYMGVIASSPLITIADDKSASTSERIDTTLIQKLISALMQPNSEDDTVAEYMLEMLDVEFISNYRDVQYYFLTSIKVVAQQLYEQVNKARKKQLKSKKNKKNDDNEDRGIDNEIVGIYAENLLRILLKIQIADDKSDLKPLDVKASEKTCSNYLFLPPHYSSNGEDSDDDDDDDGDSNADDDDDSSDSENEDDNKAKDNGASADADTDTNGTKKITKKVKSLPMQSLHQHRVALQEATLAILKLPNLPPRGLKLILQHFPSQILPNAIDPLRFADFCTKAYDMGGITSLLALNSLFILMTQCGLEYKEFYPSLYNLVEPKIFYAKYRTRFFKLLVKCLSGNQMLPAYVIAAFCKKLCRCALNAPPSGALFVLALVSNLLRKHEECACIIHRRGDDGQGGKIEDPYDAEQRDPAKSRAIESSLWELNALEQHYHPAVSGMAKGCGMEDSKTLMHNLDEFLLHTYRSLFDQERKRAGNKRRNKLPLTFTEPQGLFKENDVFDGIFDFPNKKQKL